MNGLGILGALLGGFGGISQGMGAAEKAQLEQRRLQQEQDARVQQMLLDRDRLTQQQGQFDTTRSWEREKFEAEQAATAQTRQEAQAQKLMEYLGLAQAREAIANRGARADAPMSTEGAMYSEAPMLAGKQETPKDQILAKLLAVKGGDEFAKLLYPEGDDKITTAGPGSAVFRNGQQIASVPAAPKDPTASSVYTGAVDALLSTKYGQNWQANPQAISERVNLLKPMAVQEGGFIGGPAGGAALAAGDRKPVSGETAQRVAGAEEARRAAQTLATLSRNAATAGYLGPLDQWRETVQRMTPGALAGEVPNEVVDMKQAMNTLNNYYINLISGAAVSAQEGERLKAQLPKMSSRPEIFQREVETTLESVRRLEQRISQLALHGDPKARLVAEQYGLTASAAPQGEPAYTGVVTQPDMPKFSPGPGKVWIQAPDGVWGKWDARQPVPQGYRR
jgi:hypothetical protein